MKTKLILLIILISTKTIYAQTNNTQLGTNAGANSKGIENTIIGYNTGINNATSFATIVGSFAGGANTGFASAIFGNKAGSGNTGQFLTALGPNAGFANKGPEGVFVGYNAGSNNKGINNTAIGTNSGKGGITGEHNTFLGAFSGEKNTSGLHNTYIGAESGRGNQLGLYNTFLGMRAGSKSTGSFNVFIGYEAGNTVTASNKLVIAHGISSSKPLITGDFRANHVAIGGFGDPKFTLHVLGTAHTTGTFTSSDKRFKQNIQAIEKPLEKLLAMKGVSYEFKKDATRNFPEGKTYGFIAQDVQKVLPSIVKEDKDGYLALNYECFIPLLVEALKQQETANKKLTAELTALKKLVVDQLQVKAAAVITPAESAENSTETTAETIVLHQNTPNPFHQATIIRYEAPTASKQIALHVFDLNGQPQLQLNNMAAGKGEVTIKAGQLKPGMYLYSLLVDGKMQDTKRMILTQ